MSRAAPACALALVVTACYFDDPLHSRCTAPAEASAEQALSCYRDAVERHPPEYAATDTAEMPGLTRRTYRLKSQFWSPDRLVEPGDWFHDVTIYIPAQARGGRAVLIANNGSRTGPDGAAGIPPSDVSDAMLAELARRTRTVVVSVSDVPNQPLTYTDDGRPRSEDASVAHGWKLYLRSPQGRASLPLHLPMAASMARAMTLAERELGSLDVHRFIVSGISKRGWAAWLAAVADPRVEAVVPFAADVLDTHATLKHIYRSYGQNWPIAMQPYVAEGIDRLIDTPRFAELMRIEDPLAYLSGDGVRRLDIPKYIVNASGDDFFVPDGASRYVDRLPGSTSLRMVPNAGHADIRAFTVEALSSVVLRLQQGRPLAEVKSRLTGDQRGAGIAVELSEPAAELRLWRATNGQARDFRYACGVRFEASPVAPGGRPALVVPIPWPESGWSAYFIEARFSDGFVATSPVHIVGNTMYPSKAPPADGKACRTVAGSATP